jgi:LuxR family maltose regulon positive regulatory protein
LVRSSSEVGAILDLLARGDLPEVRARVRTAFESVPRGQGAGFARAGEDPASVDSMVDSAMTALDAILHARTAVGEGRVDDLRDTARRAATNMPAALPWLTMYAGSLLQAAFRFSGESALHDEALATLRRVADRMDDPEAAIPARAMMGSVHLLAGSYHAAIELCDAALDLARANGLEDGAPSALAHQFRGYVLFEWNRLDDAAAALRRAWEASGESGSGVRSGVARVMASLEAARGHRHEAEQWLARLVAIVSGPMTLRNREWLTAVRVRHALGTGDLRAVDDWLRAWDYRPAVLARADDAHLASRLQELDGVLALLEATERWTDVLEIAPLVHRVAHGRRRWFDARALSAWAVALDALDRHDEAETRWIDALEAGDHGSFVRLYIDGSSRRLRRLTRLAESAAPNVHALRIVASIPEPGSHADAAAATLTGRQLDVLRLVARGCSNKTIARDLDLSISTVKTHLRTAFTRLNAQSRTQAVARARDLGCL